MVTPFRTVLTDTPKNKLFRQSYIASLLTELIYDQFPGLFSSDNFKLSIKEVGNNLNIWLKSNNPTLLSYLKMHSSDLQTKIQATLFDRKLISSQLNLVLNFKLF
jgi:hypothetical protein